LPSVRIVPSADVAVVTVVAAELAAAVGDVPAVTGAAEVAGAAGCALLELELALLHPAAAAAAASSAPAAQVPGMVNRPCHPLIE